MASYAVQLRLKPERSEGCPEQGSGSRHGVIIKRAGVLSCFILLSTAFAGRLARFVDETLPVFNPQGHAPPPGAYPYGYGNQQYPDPGHAPAMNEHQYNPPRQTYGEGVNKIPLADRPALGVQVPVHPVFDRSDKWLIVAGGEQHGNYNCVGHGTPHGASSPYPEPHSNYGPSDTGFHQSGVSGPVQYGGYGHNQAYPPAHTNPPQYHGPNSSGHQAPHKGHGH